MPTSLPTYISPHLFYSSGNFNIQKTLLCDNRRFFLQSFNDMLRKKFKSFSCFHTLGHMSPHASQTSPLRGGGVHASDARFPPRNSYWFDKELWYAEGRPPPVFVGGGLVELWAAEQGSISTLAMVFPKKKAQKSRKKNCNSSETDYYNFYLI